MSDDIIYEKRESSFSVFEAISEIEAQMRETPLARHVLQIQFDKEGFVILRYAIGEPRKIFEKTVTETNGTSLEDALIELGQDLYDDFYLDWYNAQQS